MTRPKHMEPHAVKARLEEEKKFGGIRICCHCGSAIRRSYKYWQHMYAESASKVPPHFPEPVLEADDGN